MTMIRFVLGDQLSRNLSSLSDLAEGDIVLMAEVDDEATYVRHHQRKIAFLFAAMRHFAAELEADGVHVDYLRLDGKRKAASFGEALGDAIARHKASRVVVTEPGEWRVLEMMKGWEAAFGVPVEIRPDDRFLCSHEAFEAFAGDRSSLLMEAFYRGMRERTGYLMGANGKPEGGRWNFDAENRKPLPKRIIVPRRPHFEPDETTQGVLALVARRFGNHFGSLADFDYPVTRSEAKRYLAWFADKALPDFGAYEDAMRQGEPLLFHSHLSALINCGLLDPRECCEAAEAAYRAGTVPLNAAEGFIRQIIGWREFVRGVYWREMPGYGARNALEAARPLPDFFWTADTDMNCLKQSIGETAANAYAHHIQRLMVIGNFCLLAGLDPVEVQEWYLVVYHDAYEWVEMPNVVGMILYADDGVFATKPYAASGNYINKMSNYCGHCRYDVKQRIGEDACPFNYLYWDFIARHRERFEDNPRMSRTVYTLGHMDEAKVEAMRGDAARFLDALQPYRGD
ncbi:cryptochrome/photolyase family protein [Aureimonas phyllosphaerae]|uniref:Deoxyribodipyrimidine photolyase-related protein n=1 Tax=Aureimonas phyllosphaerae TaxID=1166078 RepID=A0A7W6BY83_9HYPH|nr:cryptochrome/photolyase family protein [Aureimonas phyllosphaerae]MBB3936940.1 deoxyribodipyrimidine photolyase-related protein [Aureimonas phyllosphaerae]MBB3960945.1 deoxyribodipyrimidine photolyase-related protein [Aureimonas phyllosphaerae]SFF27673.1 deoxyribodipyrimidine photolyase-related protein [Aureimonas phyllosphaerae]